MEIYYIITIIILIILLLYREISWFQRIVRKISYFNKAILGRRKRLFWVFLFFLFIIIIVRLRYNIWYDKSTENLRDQVHKEYSELSDNNNITEEEFFKKKIRETIGERKSKESVDIYIKNDGSLFSFIGLPLAVLLALFTFSHFSKYEIFSHLHMKSKDRINILNKFSANKDLLGNKSIYNSIIDVLNRCKNGNNNSSLKLLLCSPLVDYPKRDSDPNNWGNEFYSLINAISNDNQNIKIDIYILHDKIINGSNPLKNFTEVLVNSLVKPNTDSEKVTKLFDNIWKKTDSAVKDLRKLSDENDRKLTLNQATDIPFQIILHHSDEIDEVIVSFAGRKILEDESNEDFYGFHSVDIDVVVAFNNIFEKYAKVKRRTPIKPQHSLKIIDSLGEKHTIDNYLLSYYYNNLIDRFKLKDIKIEVPADTFSPSKANSSKFTSLVLKTILGKNDKVLEIGSGTGVQSIIAYKTQLKLRNPNPFVYAIEMDDLGFKSLLVNLKNNNVLFTNLEKGIKPLKASLMTKVRGSDILVNTNDFNKLKNNEIIGGEIKLIEYSKYELNEKNFEDLKEQEFDFLIADLPYVDTSSKGGLESAFFDPDHNAHRTLFYYFKNNSKFGDTSRLLTSFSTLGGEEDIIRFELMIIDVELYISHKQSFFEDEYEWIVYTIVKKEQNDYWKDYLNIEG